MAVQKTYFVLPGFFEEFKNSLGNDPNERLSFTFTSYKVAGVEQLQNFPVTGGLLTADQAELDDCNADMTTCNLGGVANSYNPFYNYLNVDFPLVNGVHRGISTGTTNGVNYGFNPLNITIDKEQIYDGFGNLRNGSFAIDIDYDLDFYLKIRVDANPAASANWFYGDQVSIEIRHIASECSSTYLLSSTRTGAYNDIYFYGFLKGETEPNEAKDYHIVPSCFDLIPVDVCEGYSGYSIGILAKSPQADSPQIIKKTCCDELKVFAELGSKTDNYKNDFKSLIFKRQLPTDTYDFKLVRCSDDAEYVLDGLSPYGTFYDFGDFEGYPDYIGFTLDWYEVLNDLGAGRYRLVTSYDIAGTQGEYKSCVYNLQVFSFSAAAYTVRFDSTLNSYYESQDIDLAGLYWQDSIRVPGTFGRRQINTEIDELVYRGRKVADVKTEFLNEYSFESELISRCAFPNLADWILRGDELKVSDFNPYAADDYKEFDIKVNNYDEIQYYERTDKRIFKATFGDRTLNFRKL